MAAIIELARKLAEAELVSRQATQLLAELKSQTPSPAESAAAVPFLLRWAERLAQKGEPTGDASKALGWIGEPAAPAIRELLSASDAKLRECGLRAVQILEPALAQGFVVALIEGTREATDPKDSLDYFTLLDLKKKMDLPIEALQAIEAYEQRRNARIAEEQTIDFNLERIKQPGVWNTHAAAYILAKATERFDEIGPALLAVLRETGDHDIAKYMAEMGEKIGAIAPELVRIVSSEPCEIAPQVIRVLESMAPRAPVETALEALAATEHASARVRAAAAVAMGACAAAIQAAIPDAGQRLCALLKDPDPTVRLKAAWALGQMGAEAAGALPLLKECKRDLHLEIVCAAKEATWKIRGGTDL